MTESAVRRFAEVLARFQREPLTRAETEVLFLLVVENLTTAEISQRRCTVEGTTNVIWGRARHKLRETKGDVLRAITADYWRTVGLEEGQRLSRGPEIGRALHEIRLHAHEVAEACEALEAAEHEQRAGR